MTTAKKTNTPPTIDVAEKAAVVSTEIAASTVKATENVVKATTEVVTANYEKAVAETKKQVDAAVTAGDSIKVRYEDMFAFSKDTAEALARSTTILTKGWQDIATAFFTFSQKTVEKSLEHSKAMASVKSVNELFDMNQSFAKTGLDEAVVELTAISEMNRKLVEEAAKPLKGRVELAIETLMKPLAA